LTAGKMQALLEEGKRLEKSGDLHGSTRIYQAVLSSDPDNAQVLNRLGILAYQSSRFEQAEAFIQRAIEREPQKWKYHKNLGNVLRRLNHFKAAKASFSRALELNPASAEANYDLGILYQAFGKPEQALECYHRCLQLRPCYPQAYNNAGLIHMERNETLNATNCFQMAIQQDHTLAGAHLNLGYLYRKIGQYRRAQSCFETVIQFNPNLPEAYRGLGDVLQSLGKVDAAIEHYAKLIQIIPDSAADWVNLGTAYHYRLSLNQAMKCYQNALGIDPQLPQALLNAGIVHREWRQFSEALTCFKQALRIKEDYENALAQLVGLLLQLCDWKSLPRYSALLDQATHKAIAAQKKPAETPFLSVIRSPQPLRNLQVAEAWNRNFKSNTARWCRNLNFKNRRKNKRRLRLGYLSASFQNHPTSELVLGLLKGHDRNRYEVFTYSYGKDDSSVQRKDIVDASDRFNDIFKVNDKQAADLIYRDEVDILIDLMGHTKGARMQICAYRPAPLQVRYMGMAGSTGADFFDYIVVDRIVCPIEHEKFYSEKPVYMPFSYQVNNYASRWPDNKLKACNLTGKTPFVFCCFATAYKIDATVFQVWMKIMQQVPGSVLWLMSGNRTVKNNLQITARLMGVDPDRIVFKKKLPLDQHLERLKKAHLALDTLKVNGAATTSDALWAGLPVLTAEGSHFASRMTESLLRTVGLPEMVASDLQKYEKEAVELANSPVALTSIRKKLITLRAESPLFDTEKCIRSIEAGFEVMWKRFQYNEKPSSIDIADHLAS